MEQISFKRTLQAEMEEAIEDEVRFRKEHGLPELEEKKESNLSEKRILNSGGGEKDVFLARGRRRETNLAVTSGLRCR